MSLQYSFNQPWEFFSAWVGVHPSIYIFNGIFVLCLQFILLFTFKHLCCTIYCNFLAPVVQRVDNAIQQISIGKTNYTIHWIMLSTLWTTAAWFYNSPKWTHFPTPYSLIIDPDVCWDSTYETHKLLVTCHAHTTVPLNLPAGRLQSPARCNKAFRYIKINIKLYIYLLSIANMYM